MTWISLEPKATEDLWMIRMARKVRELLSELSARGLLAQVCCKLSLRLYDIKQEMQVTVLKTSQRHRCDAAGFSRAGEMQGWLPRTK